MHLGQPCTWTVLWLRTTGSRTKGPSRKAKAHDFCTVPGCLSRRLQCKHSLHIGSAVRNAGTSGTSGSLTASTLQNEVGSGALLVLGRNRPVHQVRRCESSNQTRGPGRASRPQRQLAGGFLCTRNPMPARSQRPQDPGKTGSLKTGSTQLGKPGRQLPISLF